MKMFKTINYFCVIFLSMRLFECTMYDYKGHEIKNVFGGLNKYLAEKTSSKEAQINFNIAQDLYDSEKDGDSKFILAQRLFLTLKNIDDKNVCDPGSFNALYHIDKALSRQTRNKLNANIPCGRIQGIYFNLVEKYLKKCFIRLPKILTRELSRIDVLKVDRVKIIFDEAIDSNIKQKCAQRISLFRFKNQIERSAVEKLYDIIDGKVLIRELEDPNYILKKLQQLAESDPDEQVEGTLSEDTCRILYEKYISEPCKYYREKLGENLFEQAEFGHRFLSNLDQRNPDFYRSWVYYKICSLVDWDGERFCENSPFKSDSE